MLVVKILFWTSLAALVWTHVGYALAAAIGARLRRRRVGGADIEPMVTVVVAAHDEEDVIERRVRNLLELDYPAALLEIVVASDASTDRTDEIVQRVAAEEPRVKLVRCPRGGKVAAQNLGVQAVEWRDRRILRCERGVAARCVAPCSCGASPTPRSATSRAVPPTRPPTARIGRAPTGASSSGCAPRSRASDRSRPATGRSTPCGGPTGSSSSPGAGTTSAFPT